MEEDIEVNEEERCYHSDFEDDLEYVLGMEDILGGPRGSLGGTSSSIFEDAYFHLLDFESDSGSDEDLERTFEVDGGKGF